MKTGRILSLLVVAICLPALALPALAQAEEGEGPFWKINGAKVGGFAEAALVVSSGEFWITDGKTGFKSGPCKFGDTENVWNGAEMGQDELLEFIVTTPCETNVPACEVAEATAGNVPWPSTLIYNPGKTVILNEIVGISIRFKYTNNAGCQAIGLGGKERIWSGTVTGLFNTANGCMEFFAVGGLTSGGSAGTFSALDCLTTPEEEGTVSAE